MRPDDAEKLARALARELIDRSNACGEKHLQNDLGPHILLTAPSTEECESLDELAGEIIEFRYKDGPNRRSSAYRRLKKASGVTWMKLREALGLPAIPKEKYTGTAAGPRG